MKSILLIFFMVLSNFLFEKTDGHGAMLIPNSWQQRLYWENVDGKWITKYTGMQSGKMCEAGWWIDKNKLCPGGKPGQPKGCGLGNDPGIVCFWFNDRKLIPDDQVVTLLDKNLRTFDIDIPYPSFSFDPFKKRSRHPWRAPGTARIDSPCGVGGGNLNGCNGKVCPEGSYAYGPKAEEFDFRSKTSYYPYNFEPKVTTWKRGSVQETAWGLNANHGGGYAYRLCKVPSEGVHKITEECFQKGHLKFYGDKQWIQWGENESTRFEFTAVRTSKGTYPSGSQWTKNPVPACKDSEGGGGFSDDNPNCPGGTQFPPPRKDIKGYGMNIYDSTYAMPFSIVDKVQVPSDILTGKYVLSWRWDCEETPQVWNTCAYIKVE